MGSAALMSVEKVHISLQCDKNNGYFACRPTQICVDICSALLKVRNISDKFVEEIKTHVLCPLRLLGLLSKLLTASLSFFMSVRLSVRLFPNRRIFMKFDICKYFFSKIFQEISSFIKIVKE